MSLTPVPAPEAQLHQSLCSSGVLAVKQECSSWELREWACQVFRAVLCPESLSQYYHDHGRVDY